MKEGKTPLQQRQERLEKLKDIYRANKGKDKIQLEKLFIDYLTECGLRDLTIKSYLETIHSLIERKVI